MSQTARKLWFPAKQIDGKGFLIIELEAVTEPGVGVGKVVALDLSEGDAIAACNTHNAQQAGEIKG